MRGRGRRGAGLGGVAAVLMFTVLTDCSVPPPGVPVVADTAGLRVLAGRWRGAYESPATDRGGSIVFDLTAGRDTARGEVMMVPRGRIRPLHPLVVPPEPGYGMERREPAPEQRFLRISFVQVREEEVHGCLERYADPETGHALFTAFRGTLEGDTIRGTFTTHVEDTGGRFTGRWWVTRRDGP